MSIKVFDLNTNVKVGVETANVLRVAPSGTTQTTITQMAPAGSVTVNGAFQDIVDQLNA